MSEVAHGCEAFGAMLWALAWGRSQLGLASFPLVIETTKGSARKGDSLLPSLGLPQRRFCSSQAAGLPSPGLGLQALLRLDEAGSSQPCNIYDLFFFRLAL